MASKTDASEKEKTPVAVPKEKEKEKTPVADPKGKKVVVSTAKNPEEKKGKSEKKKPWEVPCLQCGKLLKDRKIAAIARKARVIIRPHRDQFQSTTFCGIPIPSDDSYSIFYKSGVTSEIGGHVHILGEMDNIIYSFHIKDRTMSLSSMPCIVRESQVLVWAMLECRLEVDHRESKQEKEQDKDIEIVIRPVNTEFDSTTSEPHLLNVPFHILEMIMEHCVGVEYMRFRVTCKRCCLAAPLTQWSNVSPWFMVLDCYRGIITFIDPIRGDKYFIKTPQELEGDYRIYCSRYGWLLMHKLHRGDLVFFNPFTGNIVKLPRSRYFLGSLCFSAPPTSPDCMVVGFTTFGPSHVYIHLVSHEPPSWRRYHLHFDTDDPYSFHIPTFSGRDIYTLCNNERIHAFRDIGEENLSWKVVKNKAPRSCCKSPTVLSIKM
ncbi:hypothetical protein L1987_00374 [Smallanthus sonchifolius]|uniref:Uncharacterized protein n=1 Tax=Smallanthus sonchifolius TaxID=185202 RepID=A0ACB9K260_9ASTR|nr:hypothetical protein L1987_00374 [Smallanthus sonchifolius]